jgi:hypothetical protein
MLDFLINPRMRRYKRCSQMLPTVIKVHVIRVSVLGLDSAGNKDPLAT